MLYRENLLSERRVPQFFFNSLLSDRPLIAFVRIRRGNGPVGGLLGGNFNQEGVRPLKPFKLWLKSQVFP